MLFHTLQFNSPAPPALKLLQTQSPVRDNSPELLQFGKDHHHHDPALGKDFETALQIAQKIHRHQLRDHGSRSYLYHPIETWILASKYIHPVSEKIVAACLLHDVIENCPKGQKQALLDELNQALEDKTILDVVNECTEPCKRLTPEQDPATSKTHKAPWKQRKQAYLDLLNKNSYEALAVILADKLSNITDINTEIDRYGKATALIKPRNRKNDAGEHIELSQHTERKISRENRAHKVWFYRQVIRSIRKAQNYNTSLDIITAQLERQVDWMQIKSAGFIRKPVLCLIWPVRAMGRKLKKLFSARTSRQSG